MLFFVTVHSRSRTWWQSTPTVPWFFTQKSFTPNVALPWVLTSAA